MTSSHPPPPHNCQRGLWMSPKMDLIFPFLIIFHSSRDDLSFRNFKEAMRHEFRISHAKTISPHVNYADMLTSAKILIIFMDRVTRLKKEIFPIH